MASKFLEIDLRAYNLTLNSSESIIKVRKYAGKHLCSALMCWSSRRSGSYLFGLNLPRIGRVL